MSKAITPRIRSIITHSIPRSVWYGWGDPTEAHQLTPSVISALGEILQAKIPTTETHPHVSEDEITLPESGLTSEDIAALREVLGETGLDTGRAERIRHAGGKSYPDIYRLYHGDGSLAPDAVAFPASEQDVAALLQVCSQRSIAVVAFGGGTSVVGGVGALRGPHHAVISVDLRKLNKMTEVDPVSKTAVLQAGMRGPEFEAALQSRGLTLGHYPQSHQEATIGGYVATRSAGQASTGYGRVDDNVLGLTMVTPTGTLHLDGRAPASATGPGIRDFVVGSEGAFGIITDAKVKVVDYPDRKDYGAVAFPSTRAAVDALRTMAQELGHGKLPDVCRWSDAEETMGTLAQLGTAGKVLDQYFKARSLEEPSILLMVWEGHSDAELKIRRRAAEKILRRFGAIKLPSLIATKWEEGRFRGPYLRDHLMARGVLADTLETATTWDNLENLHDAVGGAIRNTLRGLGKECLVMAHISHIYEAGASFYYTFVAEETDDPMAQWQAVKTAACQAIESAGGVISHHHSVGSDHRPYLGEEVGPLGVRIMNAVKNELDPKGIMNPGKLIPDLEGLTDGGATDGGATDGGAND